MNYQIERPAHIEYVLARLHLGQWFGWSDSSNKTYANLVLHPTVNGVSVSYSKPSESSLTTALANAQADWDATVYAADLIASWPGVGNEGMYEYGSGGTSRGGNETRPNNIGVRIYIKY